LIESRTGQNRQVFGGVQLIVDIATGQVEDDLTTGKKAVLREGTPSPAQPRKRSIVNPNTDVKLPGRGSRS
jgi:hypothetical protein